MKKFFKRSGMKPVLTLCIGIVIGTLLSGGGAQAVDAYLRATASNHTFYLNGQQIQMEAYVINGNNYVKLRDIGQRVGFNVFWRDGVQIDASSPYTGEAPAVDNVSSETAQTGLDSVRQEMIQRINQVRRENGVSELPVNDALMNAAQDCSSQGFRTHDQQYEWTALAACGWPYGGSVNLTYFSGTSNLKNIAQKAVSNWVNSPGHFQAMIRDDVTCLGVGATVINGIAYCYMIVGAPNSHSPI